MHFYWLRVDVPICVLLGFQSLARTAVTGCLLVPFAERQGSDKGTRAKYGSPRGLDEPQ